MCLAFGCWERGRCSRSDPCTVTSPRGQAAVLTFQSIDAASQMVQMLDENAYQHSCRRDGNGMARKAWRRGESPAHCSYRLSRRRRVGGVAPDAQLDEAERKRRVGPALLKSQNSDRFQKHFTRARSESLECMPMDGVGVDCQQCVSQNHS